jgi:hypothetical protein
MQQLMGINKMNFNESLKKILDDASKLLLIILFGKNYRKIIVALWKDVFFA